MADIWRPKNAIDGRYLWLPMKWEGDQIILEWKMNGRWMTCKFISFLFMQDTVYCFHLLAGRQKRSLLYALCSALLVAAVWLLHPE